MSARLEPRRLLVPGAGIALAGILVAIAAGTPGAVAPAPLPQQHASLQIEVTAPPAIAPRVVAVAVHTVSSSLRADPAVAGVAVTHTPRQGTALVVLLETDDAHDAELQIRHFENNLDPGPLKLAYSAPALELASARSSVQGDLGRLELLIVPVALVVMLGLVGARGTLLAALSATIGVAAGLVAIRASNGYLFAAAPAAAVGLVQGIELAALFTATVRDEAAFAASGAPARAFEAWLPPAAGATLVRALAPLALLATGFDGAGSVALAAAVAAIAAFASVALLGGSLSVGAGWVQPTHEQRLAGMLRASPRTISGRRAWLALAILVPLAVSALLALPAAHAAFESVAGNPAAGVVHGLGVAAVLMVLGLGAVLALGRADLCARLRIAAGAIHVLAPPAAAAGLLVWIAQDGNLAGGLTGTHDAVYGGAVAVAIVTVTTIAAGRVALSALIARREGRELGSVGGAEVAIGAVMPAALASTLIAGAGFAALAGADLTVAREAGIAVAAGLVVDLILWRVPFFAFLARWGGE